MLLFGCFAGLKSFVNSQEFSDDRIAYFSIIINYLVDKIIARLFVEFNKFNSLPPYLATSIVNKSLIFP